jgi:hypothetical protein
MPITSLLNNALKEGFANNNNMNTNNMNTNNMNTNNMNTNNMNTNNMNTNNNVVTNNPNIFVLLVMVVIYFVLVLLVGKYLWNECLCKVVTICKPINNVFTLLGVILIVDMLHPRL